MPGEESDSMKTPTSEVRDDRPDQAEPDGEVAEALTRVQEAFTDMENGLLRDSLEAAIEAIDSSRGTPPAGESDPLGPVADALEGALDELEKGKVENLLPVIEEAQSMVRP
jgi:hypothetical protein